MLQKFDVHENLVPQIFSTFKYEKHILCYMLVTYILIYLYTYTSFTKLVIINFRSSYAA